MKNSMLAQLAKQRATSLAHELEELRLIRNLRGKMARTKHKALDKYDNEFSK